MDFALERRAADARRDRAPFVASEIYPARGRGRARRQRAARARQADQGEGDRAGLYAANMPAEVGGAGLDASTWLLYEKRARPRQLCAARTVVGRPSNILLACQRRAARALSAARRVRGERKDCLAMTEPGAGSDCAGMKTRAVRGRRRLGRSTAPSISSATPTSPISSSCSPPPARRRRRAGRASRSPPSSSTRARRASTVRRGPRHVSHRGYTQLRPRIRPIAGCPRADPGRGGQGLRGRRTNGWRARRLQVAATCFGRAERALELATPNGPPAQAVRPADRQVPGRLASSSPTWRPSCGPPSC